MTKELNDTTRKYPRTLDEAFPNDPNYAKWLHEDDLEISTLGMVALVIGTAVFALFMYYLICLIEMKGI